MYKGKEEILMWVFVLENGRILRLSDWLLTHISHLFNLHSTVVHV